MKRIIIFGLLILLIVFTGQAVIGDTSIIKTFYSVQEVSLSVSKYDQKKILTFPENPLEFSSNVNWKVSFKKNGLFTHKKAAVKFEVISANGKAETITSLDMEQKESGEFTLQPGQVCRLTLYAGRFNNIFKKFGADMKAVCTFQRSQVTVNATEMSSPGRFKLAVNSIPAANWNWTLPDGSQVKNNSFETTLPAGLAVLQLTNPKNSDTFQFDLEVMEPIEAVPSVSPLDGYEDLTVKVFANLINHYQSTSKCSWDFGDGTTVKNAEQAEHTYTKPGTYQVKLKISNSLGQVLEETWDIQVHPFNIENAAIITPEFGPIPLTISYQADPVILGTEPTSIQYLWQFGDGSTSKSPSGEHVYRKVGNYSVRLSIVDKNHPGLNIEPWTYTVTVTPPVLNLSVDASRRYGTVPLHIDFRSDLDIDGGPTDVEYDWDFNDGTYSSEANPAHTFLDPGYYEVQLTVTDRIYGTIVTKRLSVHVKPPELSLKILASQYGGIVPAKVSFSPDLEVDGGPIDIQYKWDFGDGSYDRTFSSAPVSHTYSQPGLYTVTVTARDRMYHTSVTSRVKIEVISPIIHFNGSITPLTGEAPLQLLGVGSANIQGYPTRLQYTWYINGQIYSFDREFRYLFTSPGTYKVSVTVVDALPGHTGRDSKSWNVVVKGDPSPNDKPPTPPVLKTPAPVVEPPAPTPAPVKDTQPPQLTVALSPTTLAGPNHKMVQVTATIQVSDTLDPDPEIKLVSITCNQNFDSTLDISGATIGTDDRSFFLRAGRDNNKHEDRVYTVTYSATDIAGNTRTVTAKVVVPFNGNDGGHGRDGKHKK